MEKIEVKTRARQAFQDITVDVRQIVAQSAVSDGVCILFCPHTTAGLTLNENWDPAVRHDMGLVFDELVEQRPDFQHGEGNSPAHVKSTLVGSNLTLLIDNGKLLLGSWQGVYLAEFDGPRTRKVLVKIIAG